VMSYGLGTGALLRETRAGRMTRDSAPAVGPQKLMLEEGHQRPVTSSK